MVASFQRRVITFAMTHLMRHRTTCCNGPLPLSIAGVSPPSTQRKKSSKRRDPLDLIPEDLGSTSSGDGLNGDLTQTALPVFISEPEDAFALKSAPAVLRCSVAHAISVHFRDDAKAFSSKICGNKLFDLAN